MELFAENLDATQEVVLAAVLRLRQPRQPLLLAVMLQQQLQPLQLLLDEPIFL